MQRKQFTFYRSYRDALRKLSKTNRLALYDAIIDYGLDGEVNTPLNEQQQAFFQLMEPSLSTGRRKAIAALSSAAICREYLSSCGVSEEEAGN